MVAYVSTLLVISLVITPYLSSPVKRAVNPAPLALGSTCLYSIVGGATLTLGAGAVLNAITISGTGVSPPTYAAVNNIAATGALTGFGLTALSPPVVGEQLSSIIPTGAGLVYTQGNSHYKVAEADMLAAITAALALIPTGPSDVPLSDPTKVTSGLYTYGGASVIGAMTLVGDASSVFIFSSVGAMSLAAGIVIKLGPDVLASNVFFVSGGAFSAGASASIVGSILAVGAVSIGAGANAVGTILSPASITLGAGATLSPAFTSTSCYIPPRVGILANPKCAAEDAIITSGFYCQANIQGVLRASGYSLTQTNDATVNSVGQTLYNSLVGLYSDSAQNCYISSAGVYTA